MGERGMGGATVLVGDTAPPALLDELGVYACEDCCSSGGLEGPGRSEKEGFWAWCAECGGDVWLYGLYDSFAGE